MCISLLLAFCVFPSTPGVCFSDLSCPAPAVPFSVPSLLCVSQPPPPCCTFFSLSPLCFSPTPLSEFILELGGGRVPSYHNHFVVRLLITPTSVCLPITTTSACLPITTTSVYSS